MFAHGKILSQEICTTRLDITTKSVASVRHDHNRESKRYGMSCRFAKKFSTFSTHVVSLSPESPSKEEAVDVRLSSDESL